MNCLSKGCTEKAEVGNPPVYCKKCAKIAEKNIIKFQKSGVKIK